MTAHRTEDRIRIMALNMIPIMTMIRMPSHSEKSQLKCYSTNRRHDMARHDMARHDTTNTSMRQTRSDTERYSDFGEKHLTNIGRNRNK